MSGNASAFVVRVASRAAAALIQAATLILLARDFGPTLFGVFGQAQSLGILLAAVLGFGFSARVLRLSTEDAPMRTFSAMFVLRLIGAVLAVAIILVLFLLIAGDAFLFIVAAAVFLFGDMLSDLVQNALAGRSQHARASLLILIHRLLPLGAVVLTPLPEATLVQQYILGCLGSAAVALVYPIVNLHRPTNLFRVIIDSTGYWFASVAGQLSQLDTTIVRFAGSASSIGYYSIAARMGAPLNLVTSSLITIFVPEMARERCVSKQVATFKRLRRFCLCWAVVLVLASPIIAEGLIRVIGPEYRPGAPIYIGLVVATAVSGVNQSYQALVYALGRPRIAATAIAVGTSIGLLAILIGGLLLGIFGIAAGAGVGQLAMLGIFMVSVRHVVSGARDVP